MLEKVAQVRLLVVGDVMLDRYWFGDVSQISPEAPVPVVKIERQEEKKGYYLSERSYGAIYRTIPLPPGVDGEKAQASFKNGVLTIKLPQTPEAQAKVRKIAVKEA